MSAKNKEVVRRFNIEVIQNGNEEEFRAMMAPDFINHAVPEGMPNGPESMWNTFQNILRPALSDLTVTIHDQVAEGDKVTTRKTISGVHTGTLLGVPATGREIAISVIDIVRVQDGRYAEHWGLNTLSNVLAKLSKP
ncbi:ester cyclase [Pseudorhizobium halotolerans]|uniref:Ester cyclase n=1 Tax=Pseudorhizobium halotolerans TaxID=1233081 RepID=A0ABM8PG65_9HYPH|nr:ester cyclase [Pseudorhizobium halotolerans]CAD7027967.1 ester cyclase [Pseudorhizobium halotolerans]